MMNPRVTSFLPPEWAHASEGPAVAISRPMTARREASC